MHKNSLDRLQQQSSEAHGAGYHQLLYIHFDYIDYIKEQKAEYIPIGLVFVNKLAFLTVVVGRS